MLKRLYVNNYRCLVAFTVEFDSFGVFCGPNGSGKSTVFDALCLVRDLAKGDCLLGGSGERDVSQLEFTAWQKSTTQEFELDVESRGRVFKYVVHIEQKADFEKPRILRESAHCDGNLLFERDLEGVRFTRADGQLARFPLDWRQSALAAIQPTGPLTAIAELQESMNGLLILRPNPRSMESESRGEVKLPDVLLLRLTSWYRYLAQDLSWANELVDLLKSVWPDFKSFRLVDVGRNAKSLQLRFSGGDGPSLEVFFDQLSDGEKALIGLYMVRASLASGVIRTVLIDEPDNYVGLQELQPFVLSIRELLDAEHQAIIISHHPEVLNGSVAAFGRYFYRDNHTSPTRIGPINLPEGMDAGEAMARGWIDA